MSDAVNQPAVASASATARKWGFGPSSRAYSKAEVFMGGGALLVVASDIAFSLFGAYAYSGVIWAAAAVVVFATFFSTRFTGQLAESRMWIMVGATVVAGLAAVRQLAGDLFLLTTRFGPLDVSYLLGVIGMSVGVVMMVIGAWRVWRGAES